MLWFLSENQSRFHPSNIFKRSPFDVEETESHRFPIPCAPAPSPAKRGAWKKFQRPPNYQVESGLQIDALEGLSKSCSLFLDVVAACHDSVLVQFGRCFVSKLSPLCEIGWKNMKKRSLSLGVKAGSKLTFLILVPLRILRPSKMSWTRTHPNFNFAMLTCMMPCDWTKEVARAGKTEQFWVWKRFQMVQTLKSNPQHSSTI